MNNLKSILPIARIELKKKNYKDPLKGGRDTTLRMKIVRLI